MGKTFSCKLPVKLGYRHTFVLNLKVCGAYMGQNKTKWKFFMCNNLGDDYNRIWTERFIENRYAWGTNKAITIDTEDVKINYPYEEKTLVWENDPCPLGYRVPTYEEWQAVLDERNNAREKLYDKNNKQIGWKIGDRLVLLGYEDDIVAVSFRGLIWTSTSYSKSYARVINILLDKIDYHEIIRIKGFPVAIRCNKN